MHGIVDQTPDFALEPTEAHGLSGLSETDWLGALSAFSRHADHPEAVRRYATGMLGILPRNIARLSARARLPDAVADPARFFRSHFRPMDIVTHPSDGGFVTGFFEPVVRASRKPETGFSCPLYRTPSDLKKDELYHDREKIMGGSLAGQGLEIAYVEDAVTAFFIHVQGAARLLFADGSQTRVTYAAKSGHSFFAIGRHLVALGEIDAATVSMQTIRAWLRTNPDRAPSIMNLNRSFIFFRETDVGRTEYGPVAAAKVPLTAGYSLAVDKRIHTFGTPVLVDAQSVNGAPFRRLMIAQDTGSAIVGPARGDLFFGSGDEAGELAGAVKSVARFTVLVPRDNDND